MKVGGRTKRVFCDNGASISIAKSSAVPKSAPRYFGDYTAEGIGRGTLRLMGRALITLECEGYAMDFLFWVCEDEGPPIEEDFLIGLDFLMGFGAKINCRDLLLEFNDFSTPLLPVDSKSNLVRVTFPAKCPIGTLDGADRSTNLTEESSDTTLGLRPGPESVRDGRGPKIERKIENRKFPDVNLDPAKEQAYRLSLGEFPVYLLNKVTLPPCTQMAVLVRPHRKGAACSGSYVVEPGADERPDLNIAFSLAEIRKGEPFHLIMCNLSGEPLQVSKNTPLGYLVEATTDDPPSCAPIRRLGAPQAARTMSDSSDYLNGTGPARGPGHRPYSAAADGQGGDGTVRDKSHTSRVTPDPPPPTPEELLSKVKLDHLDNETRKEIEGLITSFHDIFAVSNERIGRFPGYKHSIPTVEGQIVNKASYRIPYALRQSFQNEIQRLLSLGIIVRSDSEWCNPCLFLVKRMPNGEEKPRLIIDSRGLKRAGYLFKTSRLEPLRSGKTPLPHPLQLVATAKRFEISIPNLALEYPTCPDFRPQELCYQEKTWTKIKKKSIREPRSLWGWLCCDRYIPGLLLAMDLCTTLRPCAELCYSLRAGQSGCGDVNKGSFEISQYMIFALYFLDDILGTVWRSSLEPCPYTAVAVT
ncbi:Retrovirus-related Pol polyprotein from transposon 17.6 [Frankliniella fusca]|uniref:Retrovirus-related Pol polyprotein from transposon 17.6 n=1 Tax=Frankliniella fusca TaxID=407009 RepID=A0AAE1I189_9NEOP|nr:Retrovirus-related Pol polyprotein from transposon 17.6 [Frankliniella fusca]